MSSLEGSTNGGRRHRVKSWLSQKPAKVETVMLLADHNHLFKYDFLLHETMKLQNI